MYKKNKTPFIFKLNNGVIQVEILNYGAIIKSIQMPFENGIKQNIVAGYDDVEQYFDDPYYLGCIVGRYANRIANGRFKIHEKEYFLSLNDGPNHLHGGFEGFNKKFWDVVSFDQFNNSITLSYKSVDGEEGYPGILDVKIRYTLTNTNRLVVDYFAESDSDTPVSITNHSYFNLTGFEEPDILNHDLMVFADKYVEKNQWNIPTGNILSVKNTPFDFLSTKRISNKIGELVLDQGYDHDFVINHDKPVGLSLAASLKEPNSDKLLNIYTNQPVMHIYTANYFDGKVVGTHGMYKKHAAIAFETQGYSDGPNHEQFKNSILRKGHDYQYTTVYEFSI